MMASTAAPLANVTSGIVIVATRQWLGKLQDAHLK